MTPDVSVIVPTYNGAATLAEAIESIRASACEAAAHVEILVVDDGSTGEIPRFEDVVHLRRENGGPAAARNTGLARASAALVAFLDDDDLWLPRKLRVQLDALSQHPHAMAAIGHSAYVNVAPRLLLSLGAALIRREAFDDVGGFDESLSGSEDVDWFLRARDRGHAIIVTTDIVQLVRRDGGNITRGKSLSELSFHSVLQRSILRRREAAS
jgi:glycosyltransferase involved in cell wall biosynthesis